MGEARKEVLRVDFNNRLRLESHEAKVSTDGGLFPYRELDLQAFAAPARHEIGCSGDALAISSKSSEVQCGFNGRPERGRRGYMGNLMYHLSRPNRITMSYMVLLGPCVIAVVVANVGCTSPQSVNGVPFSRLAGSWSMPIQECFRAQKANQWTAADQSMLEELGVTTADRVLIATIMPDGYFDWTMTAWGVSEGFVGLRNAGDQCTSPTDMSVRFDVASNSYAPVSSHITIRRIDVPSGVIYPWMTMDLEAKLVADGRLRLTTRMHNSYLNRTYEKEYMLARHCEPPASEYNENVRYGVHSKLAGAWAAPDDKGENLVRVTFKSDGTFDWTRMVEGLWRGWYQLHYEGDTSAALLYKTRFRVLTSRYTRTSSRIRIRGKGMEQSNVAQDLTLNASLNLDGTLKLRMTDSSDYDGQLKKVHKEVRLYRAEPGTPHAESLSFLYDS